MSNTDPLCLDQLIKWTSLAANLVTILGISSVFVAVISLFLDRKRRDDERRERRRSLLLALLGDTTELSHAIDLEDAAYQRTLTEEFRHSYTWASFSSPMAEAALREPYLLSLNPQEMANLLVLRITIQHVNALVSAKQAVVTGLAVNPSDAASRHADLVDARIREQLPELKKDAENVQKWTAEKIKNEPVPSITIPGNSTTEAR